MKKRGVKERLCRKSLHSKLRAKTPEYLDDNHTAACLSAASGKAGVEMNINPTL